MLWRASISTWNDFTNGDKQAQVGRAALQVERSSLLWNSSGSVASTGDMSINNCDTEPLPADSLWSDKCPELTFTLYKEQFLGQLRLCKMDCNSISGRSLTPWFFITLLCKLPSFTWLVNKGILWSSISRPWLLLWIKDYCYAGSPQTGLVEHFAHKVLSI